MAEPDALFLLKNQFWLGNFQLAINEGSTIHLVDDATKLARDVYVYRAYIAVGNAPVVLDEIKEGGGVPPELAAVRLLAQYTANPDSREIAVLTGSQWLDDAETAGNTTIQLIVATMLCQDEKYTDALRAIQKLSNLEQLALAVQICLKMHRLDVAQKHLARMQSMDDEATLTQLAAAWVHLSAGGDKVLEASYVFQELIDKFGSSVVLLNGLAAARMHLGQYDEAEKLLIDAIGKSANDPDTLFNLICCAQHTDKAPEFIQRYMNQLKRTAPGHPHTRQFELLDSMFERVAVSYAV